MIVVVHCAHKDEANIFYDADKETEAKIIAGYKKHMDIRRASAEEWFGQDDPNYAIHHYYVKRRKHDAQ